MATKLNKHSFEFAQDQVKNGNVVLDQRDDWSEHQPSTQEENRYIEEHGMDEYARWHLGVDEDRPHDRKTSYHFPYGDFEAVHRCGVLSAESRAGQYKHFDIERAAAHLHGMLDAMEAKASGQR